MVYWTKKNESVQGMGTGMKCTERMGPGMTHPRVPKCP